MSMRQQQRTAHRVQPQLCITISPTCFSFCLPKKTGQVGDMGTHQSENKLSSSQANMPKLGMPA